MDTPQTAVIDHLYQTFASMRVATANRCPAGTTVKIRSMSDTHCKLEITFKDSLILRYSVQYNAGVLVDRLLVHRIESVELVSSMSYALKFVEMASQLVRTHADYPK